MGRFDSLRRTLRRPVGAPASSGRRPTVYWLAAAALLVAILAGIAWYAASNGAARQNAIRQATAGSTAAAQAIFSYDYRTFDASVATGKNFVTGQFAREYASTTATLKAPAQTQHAVVRAQVSAVGVVHATADEVELMVYLNQYRTNVDITGEKVDQNRVLLTLVPVGSGWKVSKASAI